MAGTDGTLSDGTDTGPKRIYWKQLRMSHSNFFSGTMDKQDEYKPKIQQAHGKCNGKPKTQRHGAQRANHSQKKQNRARFNYKQKQQLTGKYELATVHLNTSNCQNLSQKSITSAIALVGKHFHSTINDHVAKSKGRSRETTLMLWPSWFTN